MGYPDFMMESVKKFEETLNYRLKPDVPIISLEEKNQLLTDFHPDYRTGAHREIRIGVNKGDKAVSELVDLLEAKSFIQPDSIDLENIYLSTDVLVIGSGGAGLTAAIFKRLR